MKSGNRDKGEGKAQELKGKVKEGAGKLTKDEELEAEGKAEQVVGHGKEAKGELKKAVGK